MPAKDNEAVHTDILAGRLGANWPAIRKAKTDTAQRRAELDGFFSGRNTPDTSLYDPDKRAALEAARSHEALRESKAWDEIRTVSRSFHEGLVQLFLGDDDELKKLTMNYGVF